ncbi:hypothetical protein EOM82_03570 [bacterium]|nr:hypothetical protein [bacterium]
MNDNNEILCVKRKCYMMKNLKMIIKFSGEKLAKKLLIFAMAIVMVFSVTACVGDIDRKYKGFSSGFNYGYGGYTSIECAARSEKTEFNIDDVTLDFYVGWYKDPPSPFADTTENSFIVLYFSEVQTDNIMHIENEIDYRDADGLFYIESIPAEEFSSDKFAISMTKKSGKIFGESMKFTVPRELFNEQTYAFRFLVAYVTLSDEDNTYSGRVYAFMVIECEYIDENTIRLNRAYHK